MKKSNRTVRARRWGRTLLTLALLCALALGMCSTAVARKQAEIVVPVTPKPTVTIQGNLVTENGKPTGFYELALCVQSGYSIQRVNPAYATDKTQPYYLYATQTEYDAMTDADKAQWEVHYYPFRTATAAVHINANVLTAVNWDLESVIYEAYTAGTGYPAGAQDYPVGVNKSKTLEDYNKGKELTGNTLSEKDAFPNITTPKFGSASGQAVALDVEGDTRMTTVTGTVEDYDTANSSALVTLSASAPDNYPIVLTKSTPLVVARFAYDLKRFPTTKVNATALGVGTEPAKLNSVTGEKGGDGFWMGWDKTTGPVGADLANKMPLTWLGASDPDKSFDFTASDELAARSQMSQTVWVHMGTDDPVYTTRQDTNFYYYLGAEANAKDDPAPGTVTVDHWGTVTEVPNVTIPATVGAKVITEGDEQNPGVPYTFFENLLRLQDQTLRVQLVNEPTFKKPTGGFGGNQILFYDWDDTLIGALIVGDGDVRAEVNKYVEENLVHPDLRSTSAFMADASAGGGLTQAGKLASLQRDYTYRGKYAYTVGGNDAALGVADGAEYPLTNKLDYVFTKRVNTYLTQEEDGTTVQYVHPYSLDDAELDPTLNDAAAYPYVYGWAVVEDDSAFNGRVGATGMAGPWKVMHDAAELENTWTTMGVGELAAVKPGNIDVATPPTATAATDAKRTAPSFLAGANNAWTDGSMGNAYAYTLEGENSYLRFADFSDMAAEMDRYKGKNTLVVKAVYEPGERLALGNHYTLITEPAYTKFNSADAANGGAYKVQMTLERSYNNAGTVVGTTRTRHPLIRQDTTVDTKWLTSETPKVDHDMENVSLDVATSRTQTTYSQVDIDNGEQIIFSLSLSGRQNKIDYQLTEAYNANYVAGTQRSYFNTDQLKMNPEKFVIDNYNYPLSSDGSVSDDYYDCTFSTKEGSRGFVLSCTLGHFMEQATQFNQGALSRSKYDGAVRYTNAMDANLRMDMSGRQPDFMDNTTLQEAFLAAAAKCEDHKSDAAYDCWDVNLNAAKLTYHQAQMFLIDYQADPNCDIRTVADADGQKLPFCHYHVGCTGGHVPVAPTNWAELTAKLREYNAAAPGSDERKNAEADLNVTDLAALETMTSLRSDAAGTKFTSTGDFVKALLVAEEKLNAASLDVNWVNLQYAIINGAPADAAAMRAQAEESYFWYAGANAAPRVNDFAALLAAAETARTKTTLKDGTTTDFLPKSALAAAQFPTAAEEYLASATPTRAQRNAWVALTHNLVPSHAETPQDPNGTPDDGDEYTDYTYGKFPSMADFRARFTAVYNAAYDAGTLTGDEKAQWEVLQTGLLPPGDNKGDDVGDGSHKFWFWDCNTPFMIKNLSTLVEAARRIMNAAADQEAADAAQKEWDRLTIDAIEGVEISQSLRWKGDDSLHPMYPYEGKDLPGGDDAAKKAAILAQLQSAVSRFDAAKAADPGLILTWESIQYLLLNSGDLPTDDSVIRGQGGYYWWHNGNTAGTSVSLSPTATVEVNLQALLAATYRSDFKDPGVLTSILTATQAQDNSFWAYTKLITQKVQGTHFDRVTNTNDTYDGPDTEADVKAKAFPGATAADVQAMLDMLTGFRDKAKTALGVTDPYGVPSFLWHQIQYYVLNSETYLLVSDPIVAALRDKDTALAGDYWWYYDTVRHPPDPPAPPPANEPSQDFVDGQLKDAVKNGTKIALTKDEFAALQITGNAEGKTPGIGPCNKILNRLVNNLKGSPYVKADGTVELTWVQLQYYFAMSYSNNKLGNKDGTLTDSATALAELEKMGFEAKNFPAGVKTTFSLRPAELDALEVAEATPEATPAPDTEALQAQIEAKEQEQEKLAREQEKLDQELTALKEQLAQAEQAQQTQQAEPKEETPATRPTQTVTPETPVETPAEDPAEPETPAETPAEDLETPVVVEDPRPAAPEPGDYDERVEIPLGEEVSNLRAELDFLPVVVDRKEQAVLW